jgi:hypothetical protein
VRERRVRHCLHLLESLPRTPLSLEQTRLLDRNGNPIRDLDLYVKEWEASFEFDFVDPADFTDAERAVWERLDAVFAAIGGRPKRVKEVLVSTTMRPMAGRHFEAVGVWEPRERRIVIRRDQLTSIESFAGTVLHEVAHATSGAPDISIEFEQALTESLGTVTAVSRAGGPSAT